MFKKLSQARKRRNRRQKSDACYHGNRGAARLLFETLEDRRVMAGLIHDFQVTGTSQFSPGPAVAMTYDDFVGFDTVIPLGFDAFDDFTQTGVEVDLDLGVKAGFNLGYVVNSGSIDAFYDDVTLDYNQPTTLSTTGPVSITTSVSFDESTDSFFSTTSPTIGAYADVVAKASTSGELTGKLFGLGGTLDLSSTILDIEHELLAFNRDDDRELRVLGQNVLASEGVQLEVPLGTSPFELQAIVQPLDSGKLGLQGEVNLVADIDPSDVLPKAVKKKFDLGNVPNLGIGAQLATMELQVPAVNVDGRNVGGGGVITASDSSNLADLNLNLGLKDVSFTVGPASLTVTPAVVEISPELNVMQTATLTPTSRLTYRFDHQVTGTRGGTAFGPTSVLDFVAGEAVEIDFVGRPIHVRPEWTFQAELHNDIDIDVDLAGSFTAGQFSLDIADAPLWLKDLLQLPFNAGPIVHIPESQFLSTELASVDLVNVAFPIINETVALDPFVIGEGFEFDLTVDTRGESGRSLRNAIAQANAKDDLEGGASSRETNFIQLDDGIYRLSDATAENDNSADLDITDRDLHIIGQGVGKTVIDAGQLSRIFEVHDGAHLTLEGLTIQNGMELTGNGGGIFAKGRLDLIDVEVTGNVSAAQGGGVWASGGGSTTRTTVHNNQVRATGPPSKGGGLYVTQSRFEVTDSTISGNTAIQSDPRVSPPGGGIAVGGAGTVALLRSTISGNGAHDEGGAIYVGHHNASITITASTITDNESTLSDGGIFVADGTVHLDNSIVADNQGVDLVLADRNDLTDDGYNLIGATSVTTGWQSSTLHGTPANPIDPRLRELANNGGATQTHVLHADSPAIGAGSQNQDQRGFQIPGPRDIGATQFVAETLVVSPDNHGSSLTLQQAVSLFNAQGGTNSITLGPGTHFLTSTSANNRDLDVKSQAITINGSTTGEPSIIDASRLDDRAIEVHADATLNLTDVIISGGMTPENGGGILNAGQLLLTRTRLVGNRAGRLGGGMFVAEGAISVVTDSTFEGNQSQWGGAIANLGGATLEGSLLANNVARGSDGAIGVNGAGGGGGGAGLGGGVYNEGVLGVISSTLSTNEAVGGRGGNTSNVKLIQPLLDLSANPGGNGGGIGGGEGGEVIMPLGLATEFESGDEGGFGGGGGGASGDRDLILDPKLTAKDGADGGFGGGGGGASAGIKVYEDLDCLCIKPGPIGLGGAAGDQGGSGADGINAEVGGPGGGGAGIGGAIFNRGGSIQLNSNTVFNNAAKGGEAGITVTGEQTFAEPGSGLTGGIYNDDTGIVGLRNTVVAANNAEAGTADELDADEFEVNDVAGVFQSQGHNFIGVAATDAGFDANSDRYGKVNRDSPGAGQQIDISDNVLNPLLGPLADNGGPTRTHLPHRSSPLMDTGASSHSNDQRGVPRDIGTGDDIGAVENNILFVNTHEDDINQRSLRRAILDANRLGGSHRIVLGEGTFKLAATGAMENHSQTGDLDIHADISIVGAGAGKTIIDASSLGDRAFDVRSANAEFVLDGVTLMGGEVLGGGGAIRTVGDLTVKNSHVTGGRAANGGAIDNNGVFKTVNVINTAFTGNSASGSGGAIRNNGQGGLLRAINTTFTENTASNGGAITNRSTFGGVALIHVTISGNHASSAAAGVYMDDVQGDVLELQNTIMADSLSGFVVSNGHNLLVDSAGADASSQFQPSDLLDVDAGLTSLATEANLPHFGLLATSVAVDAANSDLTGLLGNLTTDQLGTPRVLGMTPDIGAVEQAFLEVFTTEDGFSVGTLRNAVTHANQLPGADLITFDGSLNGLPITLTDGELQINDAVTIAGRGAHNTIIDAQQDSRIFKIFSDGSETATNHDVTISNLTLQNGRTTTGGFPGGGGAIYVESAGLVTLDSVLARGNAATGFSSGGGALYAREASRLRIVNSTFSGNTTSGSSFSNGGAISVYGSSELNVTNSTVTGNRASGSGGGIYVQNSTADLRHATIADNEAGNDGGGLSVTNAPTTIYNSIVALNEAGDRAPDIDSFSLETVLDHTLIGDATGSSLVGAPVGSPDANGNLIGVSGATIDPQLGPLQANGGPVPTRALLPGSPAIDAGTQVVLDAEDNEVFNAPDTDQRGYERHGTAVDMGAFELQLLQHHLIPPTANVTVTALGDDRLVITHVHEGNQREVILARPADRLNLVPWASEIDDQVIIDWSAGSWEFQIGDFETDADDLVVSVRSSDQSIVPDANLAVVGEGTSRAIALSSKGVSPGSVTLTVEVHDEDGAVGRMAFQVDIRVNGFVVDSTGDGGDVNPGDGVAEDANGRTTLRAAIEEANALPNSPHGADVIVFDFADPGPHTISPLSQLPLIRDAVMIDGTTASDEDGASVVVIDGANAGDQATGLALLSGRRSTVRGLAIHSFGGSGILLGLGGEHTIQKNIIGTDPTGAAGLGNGSHGILVHASYGNVIGGPSADAANVISGNGGHGIYVSRSGSAGNVIQGNVIGLGPDGTTRRGNTGVGVRIDQDASENTIGSGNVISANAAGGVTLVGAGTTGNSIVGNLIGTDATGLLARGNGANGISIDGAAGNTIGAVGGGNVISGNTIGGIFVTGATANGNVIQGNLVGLDVSGSTALSNRQTGINLFNAPHNTLGGTDDGAGNVVSGNRKSGIFISGPLASGNQVVGNFIGTDATGTTAVGNGSFGLVIREASNNTVGGMDAAAGNVISGNVATGLAILDETSTGNVVTSNLIGTDVTGTAAVGNGNTGVLIWKAPGNRIGGLTAGQRNVISGNASFGVRIASFLASGNVVQGNYIGTDITGTAPLPNVDSGLQLANAQNTIIGGTTRGATNVISANGNHGVVVAGAGAQGNRIEGNLIGLGMNGSHPLGNAGSGVRIGAGARENTIGGQSRTAGNVISANGADGVLLVGANTTANTVQGNLIGTDDQGTRPKDNEDLGNAKSGVAISNANANTIGGDFPGAGNVISDNGLFGVAITGPTASENRILGNIIGTDHSSTLDLGNTSTGVYISAPKNSVGGAGFEEGNLISGNDYGGVRVAGASASSNRVLGNLIGTQSDETSPLPNGQWGVWVDQASDTLIGGTSKGAANVIAHHARSGVTVTGSTAHGNRIQGNTMFSNAGLSIDLNADGTTANDAVANNQDMDDGPNELQNFPVLREARLQGTLEFVYEVPSLQAHSAYELTIDFYAADPSGREGRSHLGSDLYTLDTENKLKSVSLASAAVEAGDQIVATATDALGNTSEFSVPITVSSGASPAEFQDTSSVSPRHNLADPADVNGNGVVEPMDALLVINALNRSQSLTGVSADAGADSFFYDTNGDRALSAHDALRVINRLNAAAIEGEGEANRGAFGAVAGRDLTADHRGRLLADLQAAEDTAVVGRTAVEDCGETPTRPTPGNAAFADVAILQMDDVREPGDEVEDDLVTDILAAEKATPLAKAAMDAIFAEFFVD